MVSVKLSVGNAFTVLFTSDDANNKRRQSSRTRENVETTVRRRRRLFLFPINTTSFTKFQFPRRCARIISTFPSRRRVLTESSIASTTIRFLSGRFPVPIPRRGWRAQSVYRYFRCSADGSRVTLLYDGCGKKKARGLLRRGFVCARVFFIRTFRAALTAGKMISNVPRVTAQSCRRDYHQPTNNGRSGITEKRFADGREGFFVFNLRVWN